MLTALLLSVLPVLEPLRGDPFTELGFDAALAQAQKEKKLLLVDFTASWCPPCKKMEKDTWAADNVRAWLKDNAIALQVDVDEQRELSKRFRIEAMPTVIAFRDGSEFERIVGYRDAAGFLSWTGDVRAGKRASDGLLERSKSLRESPDVGARYELVKELQRAGLYDEALAHYLWLWPATRGTSLQGVRVSFMMVEMARLAKAHAPAKTAFDALRSELQAKLDAADFPAPQDWQEWNAFCKYFGPDEPIVAWYEKHKSDQGRLFPERTEREAERMRDDVFEALMRRERLLDAGRLHSDLQRRADKLVAGFPEYTRVPEQAGEEAAKRALEFGKKRLTDEISMLFAVALVADRLEEATALAQTLLKAQDTPDNRLALVRAAVEVAKKPHPDLARWLDEAEAKGGSAGDLRKQLEDLRS